MFSRCICAIALAFLVALPSSAQTVRFDTNVGTIDLELNPLGRADLQAHVDNMLAYVEAGLYDRLVLNRADDSGTDDNTPGNDFVLQMGRFRTNGLTVPATQAGFIDNRAFQFAPITVDADDDGNVDFDTTGLSNTVGEVSLALAGGDPNSGTSEFFFNLNDNSFLDDQGFVPFGRVRDFATLDLIFTLDNESFFAGTFDDTPVLDGNRLVYVERAYVLEPFVGLVLPASAAAVVGDEAADALFELSDSISATSATSALQVVAVPEPPALVLAVAAIFVIYMLKPNKIR